MDSIHVHPFPICPSSHSIHPFKLSSKGYYIVSFWQPERQSSRSMYPLFVVSRETDLCGRGPGPNGAVFIPDHNFTKIYLEICGWPKGPWHHPSCQWVSFCATFLPALFHSYVRNVRSSDFFSDVVFNSLSSAASFTCFPSSFLRMPALTSPHTVYCVMSLQKCICCSSYSITSILATRYANSYIILSSSMCLVLWAPYNIEQGDYCVYNIELFLLCIFLIKHIIW